MTKQSIEKIIQNNRRPIAVHAIWAEFEKLRLKLKNYEKSVDIVREATDSLPFTERKPTDTYSKNKL
jgi:hypothetical protein